MSDWCLALHQSVALRVAALLIITTTPVEAQAQHEVIGRNIRFICTPTAVWDGDGPIWCAEGPKIRLAGIAARETDETCRVGQPCPQASGKAARNELVQRLGGSKGQWRDGHVIVHGPRLNCVSEGQAKGDRTAAWCALPDRTDLSCAMMKSGLVLRWARYDAGDHCRRHDAG
jgi:endonuclease YncB( thermonuclease family)